MKPTPVNYNNSKLHAHINQSFRRSYEKIASREKEIEQEEREARQRIVENLRNPPSKTVDPKLYLVDPQEDAEHYKKHFTGLPPRPELSSEAKVFGIKAVLIFGSLFLLLAWFITSLPN